MVESEQSKRRQLAELKAALQRNRREAEVLQWKIGQLVAEGADDRQHIKEGSASVVECNYSDCDTDLQDRSSEDAICLPGSPTTCSLENSSGQPPADQDVVGVRGGSQKKLDTPLYMPIKSVDLLVNGIGGGLSVKKVVAGTVCPILNLLIQSDPKGYVLVIPLLRP